MHDIGHLSAYLPHLALHFGTHLDVICTTVQTLRQPAGEARADNRDRIDNIVQLEVNSGQYQ